MKGRVESLLRSLVALDWWLLLLAAGLASLGVAFIHSATLDTRYASLSTRHVMMLGVAVGSGLLVLLVPYRRIIHGAFFLYAAAVVALLLLPYFGVVVNGARRWYRLPGFFVQPSEFAKLALILGLAKHLRFKPEARTYDGLLVPLLITAVPALLVLRQPDLGSSLVFWPVLLAMCFAAGAPARSLLAVVVVGVIGLVAAYFFVLHDYQKLRVDAWWQHFDWDTQGEGSREVQEMLLGPGYQPWQALIAIGGGGLGGFGYAAGPQNRYDFLPYRFDDYIFAVLAEEFGFLGALGLLLIVFAIVVRLLRIARHSRERFGRLLAVGVATYLGMQSLMHVAVCAWAVPATGLPLPLVSYGGSSTVVAVWSLALALNVGARREIVLGRDGFM